MSWKLCEIATADGKQIAEPGHSSEVKRFRGRYWETSEKKLSLWKTIWEVLIQMWIEIGLSEERLMNGIS